MNSRLIDDAVTKAFRHAFESHPARTDDPALALQSARESAAALIPVGAHGAFDDETLTFAIES